MGVWGKIFSFLLFSIFLHSTEVSLKPVEITGQKAPVYTPVTVKSTNTHCHGFRLYEATVRPILKMEGK